MRAQRKAGLAVIDGRLSVLRTGYPRLERHWEAADIAEVVVGPSGVEINDKPEWSCRSAAKTTQNADYSEDATRRSSNG